MVLVCLIFSVLSTIEQYAEFATGTLFWMVSTFYVLIYETFLTFPEHLQWGTQNNNLRCCIGLLID